MSLYFKSYHQQQQHQNTVRRCFKTIQHSGRYNLLWILRVTIISSLVLLLLFVIPITVSLQSRIPNFNQHRYLSSSSVPSSFQSSLFQSSSTSTKQSIQIQRQRRRGTVSFISNLNRMGVAETTMTTQSNMVAPIASASTASTTDDVVQIISKQTQEPAAPAAPAVPQSQSPPQVSFSHAQMYVDRIEELVIYQQLEQQLNKYYTQTTKMNKDQQLDCEIQKDIWKSTFTSSSKPTSTFISQQQDIIRQLMIGFGFRITGYKKHIQNNNSSNNTYSITKIVLITSCDSNGVQFIISSTEETACIENDCDNNNKVSSSSSSSSVIDSNTVQQFYAAHNNRPGIGVLGFWTMNINVIRQRYEKYHPNLIVQKYNNNNNSSSNIFEVYAFYNNTINNNDHNSSSDNNNNNNNQGSLQHTDNRVADTGTILRFLDATMTSSLSESEKQQSIHTILDIQPIETKFIDTTSQPAYCDHWVSNVLDRTEFLDTLYDTLQFTSKVDFNAGVVAAGEAQIESTVTGNTLLTTDSTSIENKSTIDELQSQSELQALMYQRTLRDQNQVYLPINNALSEVGHVHGFLQELGQGIQHIASRVPDLVSFVQRCNDYRTITNEGFSFLRIPRSYYGVLTIQQLTLTDGAKGVSVDCAEAIVSALRRFLYLTTENAVILDITRNDIDTALYSAFKGSKFQTEFEQNKDFVLDTVLKSRYLNLYSLLKDSVDEEQYIGIVRNQILVDIQGNDLLYQIFTSNVLQRNAGDEAPFLEFIQRVCSVNKSKGIGNSSNKAIIKPGCGGFGIRNFLTLFLSIEVSKAMQEVTDAIEAGDVDRQTYAQSMVDCFTMQLNESNPILTYISDAMTDEGYYKSQLVLCLEQNNSNKVGEYEIKMKEAAERKLVGNTKLMECSLRYKNEMKAIRQRRQLAVSSSSQ